jgi:putative nucleotidyltransferase with HDIG domain
MLRLSTDLLQPGMVLARPVIDERGSVLLRQGIFLTEDFIASLQQRGFSSVYIDDGDTEDIVVKDLLSDEVRGNALATLSQVFDLVGHVSADFAQASGDELLSCLKDFDVTSTLRSDNRFEHLQQATMSILDELMATEELSGIAQIRSHDDANFGHSVNVTATAIMIGKHLGLNLADLKRLGAGCMLHDIGKVFLMPNSQQQGQSLCPADQSRMREHPRLGYELLRARNPEAVMTNHVALEHHERQDGRGYPRRLHGTNSIERSRFDRQNTLLIAEIAAVADVYDMLSVERPGRPALTPQQITVTMHRLSGTFLNREIVRHFLEKLSVLPTGTDVIVRTSRYAGYKGVVAQPNQKQPERPLVRLLYNPQGDRISPIDLDLARAGTVMVEATLHL